MSDFAGYRLTQRDLGDWAGRVLILESEHDAAYGPAARAALRADYPGASAHTLRDAGHTTLWTHVHEFNEVARSFLAAA